MAPEGRACVNLMAQGHGVTHGQANLVIEELKLGAREGLPRAINGHAPCFDQNHTLGVRCK